MQSFVFNISRKTKQIIIKSRDSFNLLNTWLTDARSLSSPSIIIILVGNKKDLEAQREVSFQEASAFAKENGLLFVECSAVSGENIAETFLKCARSILSHIEDGLINPSAIGSGIQFGDLSLRQLSQTPADKNSGSSIKSSCASLSCTI